MGGSGTKTPTWKVKYSGRHLLGNQQRRGKAHRLELEGDARLIATDHSKKCSTMRLPVTALSVCSNGSGNRILKRYSSHCLEPRVTALDFRLTKTFD